MRPPLYEDHEFYGIVDRYFTFTYNEQQKMLALVKQAPALQVDTIMGYSTIASQYFPASEFQSQGYIMIDATQIRKLVAFWEQRNANRRPRVYILEMDS